MEERRRSPRRWVDGELVMLPSTLNVRVLDISVGGVMLRAAAPIEAHARGRLSLNLGGSLLTAEVQIEGVSAAPDPARGYVAGAKFLALETAHRQLIERFISQ